MAEPCVLITGGSAGIGRALAAAMVAVGWRVIIVSRAFERGFAA